jgi:hypothetical protein
MKKLTAWDNNGKEFLESLVSSGENIDAYALYEAIRNYYIGKSPEVFRIAKASLECMGYTGKIFGRRRRNKADYKAYSMRSHINAGRRYKKTSCEICGSSNKLSVHHIVPVSWGGETSADNSITLCPVCHKKAHKTIKDKLNRILLLKYIQPYKEEIKAIAVYSLKKIK